MKITALDWKDLGQRAATIVLDLEGQTASGGEKRRRAIKALREDIDGAITFGDGIIGRTFETLDGWLIQLVLTAMIEAALAAVRAVRAVAPVSG